MGSAVCMGLPARFAQERTRWVAVGHVVLDGGGPLGLRILRPDALGAAEVGDSGLGRNTGPSQDDNRAGLAQQGTRRFRYRRRSWREPTRIWRLPASPRTLSSGARTDAAQLDDSHPQPRLHHRSRHAESWWGWACTWRATGSGLGCPDWPTCHGGIVPPQEQEALIEFSHRFVAALVGVLVIATAVFAWRHFRGTPAVLWPALAAVASRGDIRAGWGHSRSGRSFPPEIVATHLLLAMTILTVLAATALGMFTEVRGGTSASESVAATRVGQRAAVALHPVRGRWCGWAATWERAEPRRRAKAGPPATAASSLAADDQQITHMTHRYLAALLLAPLAWMAVAAWRERETLRWGMHAAGAAVGDLRDAGGDRGAQCAVHVPRRAYRNAYRASLPAVAHPVGGPRSSDCPHRRCRASAPRFPERRLPA